MRTPMNIRWMPLSAGCARPGERRSVSAEYRAHTGRRYGFRVRWHLDGPLVRWDAAVLDYLGRRIASPVGAIACSLIASDDEERWVRAAVELFIERLAKAQPER